MDPVTGSGGRGSEVGRVGRTGTITTPDYDGLMDLDVNSLFYVLRVN